VAIIDNNKLTPNHATPLALLQCGLATAASRVTLEPAA